jgi:hypothetical protein
MRGEHILVMALVAVVVVVAYDKLSKRTAS